MTKRRRPKGKDTPYDSLTGHGGERLAAEVYYYTNCATAAEFAAWWKAHENRIDPRATLTACAMTTRLDISKTPLSPEARVAAEMALTLFLRTWHEVTEPRLSATPTGEQADAADRGTE